MRHILLLSILLFMVASSSFAQTKLKNPAVYVDSKGIMRWSDTKQEASFYGVNYSIPFAHAYRAMKNLGYDFKNTMDKDVYHFARLGFNAYRIHVWDLEISDKDGNLVENDHLDYLDYLLSKLKDRNIMIILTVMRMKHNANPDPGVWYGGFTDYWEKCEGHINTEAITAHVNFTQQFIKHVNPYTGISYMNDPDIIGFEVDNEPCHPGTADQMRYYIDTLVKAYKDVGNKKPVFYNVSHNLDKVETYYQTDIEGTTYQWYPTGLVSGFERKGNFLPHTDEYYIPFKNNKNFDKKAKIVYEFDAPDVTASYLYPSIARAFRTQGIQWITMFAYDAMDLGAQNTEYAQHFLNLAYSPDKAISMKIAAEVTRLMPLGKEYEPYPKDTIFESFRVSYLENQSEMNTPEKFFHANITRTPPVQPFNLKEIAGHGSSPIVKYEGTGAYFIDKLEDGVWRIEIMPDVLLIGDPFTNPSLKKDVVAIMWNTWPIEIDLPNLGSNYSFTGLNSGNNMHGTASGKTFNVSPGVYMLIKSGILPKKNWNADTKWGVIQLGEYYAPISRAHKYIVVHEAAKSVVDQSTVTIKVDIAGPTLPDSVVVYAGWRRNRNTESITGYSMKHIGGLKYEGVIPNDKVMINNGSLYYMVTVYKNGQPQTFPGDVNSSPKDWDYYWHSYYESPIVTNGNSISLLTIDNHALVDGVNSDIEVRGLPDRSTSRISKSLASITETEIPRLKLAFDGSSGTNSRYFVRKFIKPYVDARRDKLYQATYVCLLVKNPQNIDKLNVGFVTNTGFTYTAPFILSVSNSIYKVPVSKIRQTSTALLPDTYPSFMKRFFIPDTEIPFMLKDVEILEISTEELLTSTASFELGAVWLE